jgi:CRISPR-associated endonuclease/helicase Cas3
MPATTEGFAHFFTKATGYEPYAYQCALGEGGPPAILEIPTGAGKTQALIASWLYGRRELETAPRRLVYALPMRSLVEQTASVALGIRRRLGLDEHMLPIHMLMGGVEKAVLRDWREWPERDQILIGTIDMLLSRALNRGYSESRYQWPVAFGLLNNDCRWVFDEVQLMQNARVTAAQLDGLRTKLGVALPCETIWASATVDREALLTVDRPGLGHVLQLPPEDRERDGPLKTRLNAGKLLRRVDLTNCKTGEVARTIAKEVAEHHRPGTRSIVVLNRVDLAQDVTRQLERRFKTGVADPPPEVVLLHSRYRPPERREHMDAALAAIREGPGRIVVATQVIEAGIDISSTLIATETAPFSSIVQRLGRCNREGKDHGATVLWLDRGEPDAKQAAPYAPEDIATARAALLDLVGQSLSPAALEGLDEVPERRDACDVLRRSDLLDLFDTSPDLSGMDVDVASFIRDDDERSVFVFFRDLTDTDAREDQPRPERDEFVNVPLPLGDRDAWVYDPVDDAWRPIRRPQPGSTLMLAAADGGYDAKLGWSPGARAPVVPLGPIDPRPSESLDGEEQTFSGTWMSLSDHLAQAEDSAVQLIDSLSEIDARNGTTGAVIAAAALHDVGKAHPAFQEMLCATVDPEKEPREFDTTIWAKSEKRKGGRNKRRHFRHELASALALRSYDGGVTLPSGTRDLIQYLVAAHHGRVRLSIRPAPQEEPPTDDRKRRFALGVHEGDELPEVQTPLGPLPSVTLSLACMELGGEDRNWVQAACELRDDPQLGPFRLGFLEALVRVADWRASD